MDKLIVQWRNKRYYQNNWIVGEIKILDILEVEDFDEISSYPFKINRLAKVTGNINFEPIVNTEYVLYCDYVKDPKWGEQLHIISMNENIKLTSLDDKKAFLKQILTPNQIEEFYSKYKDPFEILKAEDVTSLTKINGVGEIMANKLISRFKSTVDNAPAYIYFNKYELTTNLIDKLVNTYGGPKEAITEFKSNPYILIDDVDGIGFIKADEIALKYGINKHDEKRIEAGIIYYLMDVAKNEGSTFVKPNSFKNNLVKLLEIDFNYIKNIFDKLVEKDILYVNKENQQISLSKYYQIECNISNKIKDMINYNNEDEEYLGYNKYNISDNDLNNKIKEIEEEQGFEFTDEQKDGIIKVIRNNIIVITGGAGTGKSTVINGFIKSLPSNCDIAQTAFSAQAAKRMTETTGYPSQTIHRLLGYVPGKGFTYDKNNKLNYDVVILDECSMVPLDLFWYLIQSIKDDAKLIILGDNRQLPPIGIGNLFTDLLNSNLVPKQLLTKIHRQAAKSAIITNSIKVRNMEQIVEVNNDGEEIRGELQDFIIGSYFDKNKILDKTIDAFKKEWEKCNNINDLQVIVPMKDRGPICQKILNNKIQEIVNPRINGLKEISLSKDVYCRVGDKVINRKNNYNVLTTKYEPSQVFNGSIGIVKQINDNSMIIDFNDIGELIIKSDMYKGIQLAYAITCHSSQGSQWKKTFTLFDNSAFILLSSEWIYTAMTRAKEKCYMFTETPCIRDAIKRTSIKNRDTFLKELLDGDENVE